MRGVFLSLIDLNDSLKDLLHHKNGDITDDEKKAIEEEPIQYEEIEVDEANPDDELYDPKVGNSL